MFFLVDFSVIKPDPGLIFWTTVIFATFWLLMAKFAFRPIGNALKKRETDIQNALDAAKVTRAEMENLKDENVELLAKAREERSQILKEAKEARDYMVNQAKKRAKEEAALIVQNAKNDINSQKLAAIKELKNEVGNMALNIAAKVLRKELDSDQAHKDYVEKLVDEIQNN